MTDYLESDVSGKKWRRCFQLAIRNERGATPEITFFEEDVLDGTVRLGEEQCSVTFDPDATVQMFNPETLEPTGETFTHQQLHQMLFSAYLQTALERDRR